jgi:DNA invertase Pin-like site-specific DNA recombinase
MRGDYMRERAMQRTNGARCICECAKNPCEIELTNTAQMLKFTNGKERVQERVAYCTLAHHVTLGFGVGNMKCVALYVRVSTDQQTVENQIQELTAIAQRRGWTITQTYRDEGISGAKGRDKRPGLDQMLKDAKRRKFDVAMAFAIDRLGRSLVDLLTTIQELEACGVDLVIAEQAIDTTTPMGRLLFQVTGAFAEFERSMIRQRVQAGIDRARAESPEQRARKNKKAFGRPATPPMVKQKILDAIGSGASLRAIGRQHGVSVGTVRNIRDGASETA